ncbi:hypothetical protein J4Q44_G00075270 [Coregonus suidteri]|uniref:Uncharacterized protein n=1 Tax=Coregonus suidteri TaxID=861788 RepID=A0AAN8MF57_9TELE
MTQLQYLNVYLTERLMQAAEEILGVVGDTISEYQEEITRTKRENQYLKRHLITPVLPAPQPIPSWVLEQQTPPEQHHCEQEWSPSLGQRDPESTQIKEEQGELRTRQEVEQIQGPEADTKVDSISIPPCVKSDCDQEPPQPTHLPQTVENRERDSLLTNTTGQIKTEPDGEGYGVSLSESTSDSHQSHPLSALLSPFSLVSRSSKLPLSNITVSRSGAPVWGRGTQSPHRLNRNRVNSGPVRRKSRFKGRRLIPKKTP